VLAFPEHKVEYAIFRGIEQEGPFKGTPTYFIVGDVPFDLIKSTCDGAAHVYFGAGGRFDYNPTTVVSLVDYLYVRGRSSKITIESPVVDLSLMNFLKYGVEVDFLWHLPIMWHGLSCDAGLASLQKINMREFGSNVAIKIDTGYSTYSTRLSDFPYSHYNDYADDVLLIQKDKQ
jgi:hypothetical protein